MIWLRIELVTQASVESQRAALTAVLSSRTFDRSEQLKAILRYVCERTWEGRGAEVSEYTIGVDVLGRGKDFSPHEDSIVRNRAYVLRKKLEEFYEGEGAAERIRIDLPKGSYTPHFAASEGPGIGARPAAWKVEPTSRRTVLSIAGGAVLGTLGTRLWLADRLRPEPGGHLRAFWGPMLHRDEKVALCVGTPPQSFLRTFPDANVRVHGTMAVDKDVQAWLSRQRVERHGPYVGQVPTTNSPLWGDAAGAVRVGRMLADHGVEHELLAERLVAMPALRNRNVIFLATSEYSGAAARLLRDLPLGIAYDPVLGDHVALRYGADGAVVERFPVQRTEGVLTDVYGLITRIAGDGDGEKATLYVVLSGVTSAGIQAAAEYATSNHHLEKLAARTAFDREPLQVLLKVKSDKTLPMSFEYAVHAKGRRR